jgi:hypothetical protein
MPSLLFEQFTSRRRTGQPMRRPSFEKVLRPGIVEDLKIRSRRQSSAMLSSPRRPSSTMRILPSAEECRRVAADVLHKLFHRLLRQPRAYRSFQGRKRTCGRRRLWRSQNSDQRCRHGARKRRTRCCLPPSAGRNGMPSLMKSAPRRIFCGFART